METAQKSSIEDPANLAAGMEIEWIPDAAEVNRPALIEPPKLPKCIAQLKLGESKRPRKAIFWVLTVPSGEPTATAYSRLKIQLTCGRS